MFDISKWLIFPAENSSTSQTVGTVQTLDDYVRSSVTQPNDSNSFKVLSCQGWTFIMVYSSSSQAYRKWKKTIDHEN